MERIKPQAHQESVWDYPRPPRVVRSEKHVRVVFGGEVVAESRRCFRLLETSHPPSWYIPPEDVRTEWLVRTSKHSFCEFKGTASYWSIEVGGKLSTDACWAYERPAPAFELIKDCFCFYKSRVDECSVDGEIVQAQAGDFYGGWITSDITGPFKGGPGTWGW